MSGMSSSLAAAEASSSSTGGTYQVPMVATVFSIVLAFVSISLLAAFFALRVSRISSWKNLPLVNYVIYAIYIDSWIFVCISAILRWGPNINTSYDLCSAAIWLCLSCYVTTKILIYFFLVEKAFVVWGGRKRRMQSKLYLFNSFGMLSVFAIIGIFNFIYRISYVENGKCVIGMQRPVLIPLVSFDLAVNIYLTVLFMIPLYKSNTFQAESAVAGNTRLRDLVVRTFVGAVTSTLTCVLNITITIILNGEPGWLCLMSCNIDILFDAIILQYVTSRDNKRGTHSTDPTYGNGGNANTVAVERSVVIHHSTKRATIHSPQNQRDSQGRLRPDPYAEDEEIAMSRLGAAPAGLGLYQRDSSGSDKCSTDTVEDVEMGNRTDVFVASKQF